MPRNTRIPQVDRADKRLEQIATLIAQEVAHRGRCDGWLEWSEVESAVVAEVRWLGEEKRLQELKTDAPRLIVGGEPYERMSQPSTRLYHGLWGAHRIEEPLYRREGVHNGPTTRPLDHVLGIVDGSLLPDLALASGGLAALVTSREVETTLTRLGFRPPSRATLQKRLDGLFDDMATTASELEEKVRDTEELDFELASLSAGLDRFATRMDEELPPGPARDAKLKAREGHRYERTPPQPYESMWKMAWAANVTLYDHDGVARKSLRYGIEPGADADALATRMVHDIVHLIGERRDVPVTIIQDGARDLLALPNALKQGLPEGIPRRTLVDFYHAVAYLDAVVAARDDGDPCDMRGAYRSWLLHEEDGAQRVVAHLRREEAKSDQSPGLASAVHAARVYFEKRRPLMKYKAARDEGLTIGSGSTESTCALHQLRVKHPGSHWRRAGLRGVLCARAFHLSDRFDAAFRHHHATLTSDVVRA